MGGPLFGQISMFPMTGVLANPSNIASIGKVDEKATPGYYAVTLKPWDVKVELTATRHVALHRHSFPESDNARVLIDVGHVLYGTGAGWSSANPVGGSVQIDTATREVSGEMTYAGGRGGRSWKVFFVARFDTAFDSHGTWSDGNTLAKGSSASTGNEIGAFLNFKTTQGQRVTSKIALSYRSLQQARGYFAREAPAFDFDKVRRDARAEWTKALDSIRVEGGTHDQRTQFYTALYRVHLSPNDWTGEAPQRYGNGTFYENILCMWDTFRSVNPLLTLILPDVQRDIVNTMIAYHKTDGWTGDAHSVWEYEHVQNGSSADIIIADAYAKKLPGIDWREAYEAIRKNAFTDHDPQAIGRPNKGHFRLDDYRKYGYVPTDVATYGAVQAVSRSLEYAYNDFAVLSLARRFGSAADIEDLEKRLFWYRNVWDADTGFMRGRAADGSW